MESVLIVIGAAIRWFDGSPGNIGKLHVPNGIRVAGMLATSLASAWCVTGMTWEGAWVGLVGALALIVGNTDWKDFSWQGTRFGLFGLAAIAPLDAFATYWPVAAMFAAAGMVYPVLFWLDDRWTLPRIGLFDGPEAYARIPAGAICLGWGSVW